MFLIKYYSFAFILLIGMFQIANSSKKEVYYRLYNGSVDQSVEFPSESAENVLKHPYYKPLLETLLYIFGFTGSCNGSLSIKLFEAAFSAGDINVICCDWETLAAVQNYFPLTLLPANLLDGISYLGSGIPNYLLAGYLYSEGFGRMVDAGFDLKNAHFVGFSLGAQTFGITAQIMKSKGKEINWMLGCDPASEGFQVLPSMTRDCAKFVSLIFTDTYAYQNLPGGHINFWVNLGYLTENGVQPGCPPRNDRILSNKTVCSHNRAVELYAQSISSSIKCDRATNYQAWVAGEITGTTDLGERVNVNAPEGNYYVNTTAT